MKDKQLVQKFVRGVSKAIFMMAILFAITPCAGKMYEPILPEQLKRYK